jgi:hypothetical protein
VRDLDLLEQYLMRLRQSLLQESHSMLIGNFDDTAMRHARSLALQAELVDRIRGAVRELGKDAGAFVKGYLA